MLPSFFFSKRIFLGTGRFIPYQRAGQQSFGLSGLTCVLCKHIIYLRENVSESEGGGKDEGVETVETDEIEVTMDH